MFLFVGISYQLMSTPLIFTNVCVKVIGVEPEFAASYTAALKAGKPVAAPITPTLADGLAVPMVGPHAF